MEAYLILEDGTTFTGRSIGSTKDVISEIVFNTSMTGYLEVLTDPSYAGQAVVMTYPLIGNYGICREDMEAKVSNTDGFIVRELSRLGSNFRNEQSIQDFLVEQDIPGIEGIDTRALTKILREKGTMNGMITTKMPENMEEALAKIKDYSVRGVVDKVTTKEIVSYRPGDLNTDSNVSVSKKVAILDVGTKFNIARCLLKRGCEVTIFPARTNPEDILAINPDGIMLTNGPGDPKECTEVIQNLKSLYQSDVPIFAICLGHQLMALATGCDTEKMKYGHRGANHPVKDLETGRVYISSQNHGYMVKEDSVPSDIAEVAFINVNDKTVEGLKYKNKNIFTVQFHPEACAGPKDSEVLFDRFIKMMEER
ncbi:MAG: carbamoyl phosphate synthase small subunit [Eubacterium sp.]|jgi:carbamoyl-phosphate synthase small subunit|nr:carbamoyl-phosphate synthase small chain [Clostridium sp. CAG:167]